MVARRLLALLFDTLATGSLAFAAFRVAILLSACRTEGNCFVLTPLVVVLILTVVFVYFAGTQLRWKATLGEVIFGLRRTS